MIGNNFPLAIPLERTGHLGIIFRLTGRFLSDYDLAILSRTSKVFYSIIYGYTPFRNALDGRRIYSILKAMLPEVEGLVSSRLPEILKLFTFLTKHDFHEARQISLKEKDPQICCEMMKIILCQELTTYPQGAFDTINSLEQPDSQRDNLALSVIQSNDLPQCQEACFTIASLIRTPELGDRAYEIIALRAARNSDTCLARKTLPRIVNPHLDCQVRSYIVQALASKNIQLAFKELEQLPEELSIEEPTNGRQRRTVYPRDEICKLVVDKIASRNPFEASQIANRIKIPDLKEKALQTIREIKLEAEIKSKALATKSLAEIQEAAKSIISESERDEFLAYVAAQQANTSIDNVRETINLIVKPVRKIVSWIGVIKVVARQFPMVGLHLAKEQIKDQFKRLAAEAKEQEIARLRTAEHPEEVLEILAHESTLRYDLGGALAYGKAIGEVMDAQDNSENVHLIRCAIEAEEKEGFEDFAPDLLSLIRGDNFEVEKSSYAGIKSVLLCKAIGKSLASHNLEEACTFASSRESVYARFETYTAILELLWNC